MKKALITGVTGQDGAVLAKILLDKGYEVHGMRTYSAVPDEERIADVEGINLHYGDMLDGGSLTRLINDIAPDEIYNMAALSHVHVSAALPEVTGDINALGPLRILEVLRHLDASKEIKFYQASSSEMFGLSPAPQNERTEFQPCSPYGIAKLYAYWMVRHYREAYGLYAANGILFNHESSIRGEEFVTRKITKAVCEIEAGKRNKVMLGNLDSKRDWGHAHDYMVGAWQILQQDKPDDFVLATGQSHTVREFVEQAFQHIGRTISWVGTGADEQGRCSKTGEVLVEIDPSLYRACEIQHLLGDASKAKKELGWAPQIAFEAMIAEMIEADRLVVAENYSRAA